ncbi:MAG: UTP--glucose-1-phosphate uridylyltransferase GalU [Ruminococcus sp.]|nr:UTP--glucose-1-phosphate uridylyltransferase GalU [Ruminococcus sp.]MEE0675638.1 UTP--glucose-1-phosphate uridylyltransferase GalU [Ruminococcus sp.]MEE1171909.1 UTP--glucose-1-phosphate uridylyltransferase GalU [Ruminococcus sp.]
MKIKKAVIPAAGFGTRVLPATKNMPKEMFPIVDKPTIQFIVEEAVAAGITDILIITNRGKDLIEDHFDKSPELESLLERGGKTEFLETVRKISDLANISFIRQKEMKGLGHAVLKAKSFVGDEPFAVMYGDGVIVSETPCIKQLIDCYGEYGEGVVGVKKVDAKDIHKYGSLKVENLHDNVFKCTDMKEKPQTPEEVLSLYSILDRCVLPAKIFDILERTAPGAGGEIQLTDAMREIAVTEGMVAVEFEGKRYDMGNKFGILQAQIEVGLKHPETGDQLKEYIKNLAKTL